MKQWSIVIDMYAAEVQDLNWLSSRQTCLGMRSILVDRNSAEEESRCAMVVDPNFVLSVTLRVTSSCRGSPFY